MKKYYNNYVFFAILLILAIIIIVFGIKYYSKEGKVDNYAEKGTQVELKGVTTQSGQITTSKSNGFKQ